MKYLKFFLLSLISFLSVLTSIYYFESIHAESHLTINNDDFSNQNDWSTYIHKDNEFQLNYPPDWKQEGKISKFHLLDFKLIRSDPFSFIGISYSDLHGSKKYTNSDILKQSENFAQYGKKSSYKTYNIIESNLTEYEIDNNPSSAHIVSYVYRENNLEGKLLEIFSIIDSKLFTLTYQSTLDNFDKDLEIVKKIVNSIKFIN